MSDDFDPYYDSEVKRADESIKASLEIAKGLISSLPQDNDIRTTSILVGAGFELLFDTMLRYRFETDRFSKDFMINKKREILESERVIDKTCSTDLKVILNIRNHCAHQIKIDEKLIRSWIHGIKTYQDKENMKGKNTGEELQKISICIMDDMKKYFIAYVTSCVDAVGGA